jgi:hypothetical protein
VHFINQIRERFLRLLQKQAPALSELERKFPVLSSGYFLIGLSLCIYIGPLFCMLTRYQLTPGNRDSSDAAAPSAGSPLRLGSDPSRAPSPICHGRRNIPHIRSVRLPFGWADQSAKNGFSNVRLLETEIGIYWAIAPRRLC